MGVRQGAARQRAAATAATLAVVLAVVSAAHAGYGDTRDPRGDVTYGGKFGNSQPADRPDLDILAVDLERDHARRLRWTVRFAAPPPRPRKWVHLVIRSGRHEFSIRGRRLERVTMPVRGRCCEISYRRARFRVGKRRLRWSVRRNQLFNPRKLNYQVVSDDPRDTRDLGNDEFELRMSAMDFAPDSLRNDKHYDVRPPRGGRVAR